MIGMYIFIILVIRVKKTIGDLSHMCGKLYVCTRGFEVYFMLQPQSSPKVTISIYVIWWKLLFHSTILLPFPRLYKAELTTLPSMIQMMRLKISGEGPKALRFYQNRSHHHQEEEEMAKAGVLAFLLFGWQENRQIWLPSVCQFITHGTWRMP